MCRKRFEANYFVNKAVQEQYVPNIHVLLDEGLFHTNFRWTPCQVWLDIMVINTHHSPSLHVFIRLNGDNLLKYGFDSTEKVKKNTYPTHGTVHTIVNPNILKIIIFNNLSWLNVYISPKQMFKFSNNSLKLNIWICTL